MNGFMDMDENELLPVILCALISVSLISKFTKRCVLSIAMLLTGVHRYFSPGDLFPHGFGSGVLNCGLHCGCPTLELMIDHIFLRAM